jgi:uncharacterized protein
MAFSIYEASVPVYVRQLNALSAILTKAAAYAKERKIDPAALLNARLYPDMITLVGQVQNACNHARRGVARLSGTEPERVEDKETSFDELQTLIGRTVETLNRVDSKTMDESRTVTFPVGDHKRTMNVADYLHHFSMPNFYFHVTIAYAILRHNGLDIGKADFMGKQAT